MKALLNLTDKTDISKIRLIATDVLDTKHNDDEQSTQHHEYYNKMCENNSSVTSENISEGSEIIPIIC